MHDALKLKLSDDLSKFVRENSGEGTPYTTPSEFVCAVLQEKREQLEAARIRDAILDGNQDAIEGRTVPYRGNLRQLLKRTDH